MLRVREVEPRQRVEEVLLEVAREEAACLLLTVRECDSVCLTLENTTMATRGFLPRGGCQLRNAVLPSTSNNGPRLLAASIATISSIPSAGCAQRHWFSSSASRTLQVCSPVLAASTTTSPPVRPSKVKILDEEYTTDDYYNLPPSLVSRLSSAPVLPYQASHPIQHLRSQIEAHLSKCTPIRAPSPIVSTHLNFEMLGFPQDHPGRSPTDTYYINRSTCLRTHTSAHEVPVFQDGHERWVLTADVYRRDEIDSSHYPIFHQMEGASIWSLSRGDFAKGGIVERECEEMEAKLKAAKIEIEDNVSVEEAGGWQSVHEGDADKKHAAELSLRHLKGTLNGLALEMFGERHAADVASASQQGSGSSSSSSSASSSSPASSEPLRVRWISATFPFTSPSFEVEVWFRGKWLEILGCGIVMQKTMDNSGLGKDMIGHAFGLGLERIAMILYSIPDIRLFWSQDQRFLSQFATPPTPPLTTGVQSNAGGNTHTHTHTHKLITFKPFSKYPACYKDVSFWLPTSESFHENDLMEIVREHAGDLAEDVKLIDAFTHPKTGRKSACYRINYRSMERSLENDEVNALHAKVVADGVKLLGIEIR